MNQYEAMFLFDPTFGNSFEKCEAEIRRLMERAQAEIILCRKWDERRLAYRIKGRKRGVYVLVYFKAPPQGIAGLERDAKLAENILRLLVLRADHMTREAMEQVFTAGGEAPVKTGDAPVKTGDAPVKTGDAPVKTDEEAAPEPEPGSDTAEPPDLEVAVEADPETGATTETAVAEPPADEDAENV